MAVINDPNTAANIAKVDANGNVYFVDGYEEHPAAGGMYSVAGGTTAVIAVSLAADTSLMAMRFASGSTRRAYITKFRLLGVVHTAGAAGGIGTILRLQRFTTATPTGGTARTPNELHEAEGTATDMTDVRDNNAALTMTSVVFGTAVAVSHMPNSSTNVAPVEWIVEPRYPIVLAPGDGLCLRTLNAGPGTATWGFSYNFWWTEKAIIT